MKVFASMKNKQFYNFILIIIKTYTSIKGHRLPDFPAASDPSWPTGTRPCSWSGGCSCWSHCTELLRAESHLWSSRCPWLRSSEHWPKRRNENSFVGGPLESGNKKNTSLSHSDGVGRAEMKCFTVPSQTFVCVSGFFSVQICVLFLVQVNVGITSKSCMIILKRSQIIESLILAKTLASPVLIDSGLRTVPDT